MKKYEEDEIQVLGTSKTEHRCIWKIIAVIIGCIAMIIIVVFLYLFSSNRPVEPQIEKEEPTVSEIDTLPEIQSAIKLSVDSINDVSVTIYSLKHLKAELSFELPDRNDTTVFLAVQAADIRKDNKDIVGDFVIKGKQLSKGKRKTGYCAIINGIVSLGNSINEEIKEMCIQKKGDFFRQYALVMDGEIQENRLKGKAIRRALAKQNNDLYIVESKNRESLYDFSEALADFGFTQAIYLVGGSSYGWWRESRNTIHDLGLPNQPLSSNINYIVFKKLESN